VGVYPMTPHRVHRPDINRKEIVKAFEALGWSVINTNAVGEGFCDFVAVKHEWQLVDYESAPVWRKEFIEVKSDDGELTPKEAKFHEKYPGLVHIVRSAERVREEFGEWKIANLNKSFSLTGIVAKTAYFTERHSTCITHLSTTRGDTTMF